MLSRKDMNNMQSILISLLLILILVFTDLVPMFKKKEKQALWFTIPSFVIALAIYILNGLNLPYTSPIQMIILFMQSTLKIK